MIVIVGVTTRTPTSGEWAVGAGKIVSHIVVIIQYYIMILIL